MKITLIFLSVFLSSNLFGQIVNIPDPYFKEALIIRGVDTNNDGEIQLSEATSVTSLNFQCCWDDPFLCTTPSYQDTVFHNISDLRGIEAFTSLGTISMYNNQLTEVDLSQCISLGSCNIEKNPLSWLNVKNGNYQIYGLTYECFPSCIQVEDPSWCNANWDYEGTQGYGPFYTDCLVNPIFDPVGPYCVGENISPLPTTSNNGITGTWSPAINNTTTTTYTFIPDAGQYASIMTMPIDIIAVDTNVIDTTICNGAFPFAIDGLTFNTAGSQIITLTSLNGCDSLVKVVNVTESLDNTVSAASTNPDVCINTSIDTVTFTATGATGIGAATGLPAGVNAIFEGNMITVSGTPIVAGTFNYTIPLTGGCGAVEAAGTITITNSNTGTDVQTACDSYTWIDGNTYTTNNNSATFVLTNAGGCDSTVTLDLTITNSNTGTDVQTACDSYTWIDGNTYTTSNNSATWILTNASGCDSTVTLDLTITNSNTGTDVQTACGSYTWIDGITYTASNNSATWVLTNAGGCDSTVTLDLTITNSNTGTDVQTACDSYTWIDGNTYTTNNNSATFVLTNAGGCDSTVTLDLTINESPVIQIKEFDVSACGLTDGSIEVTGLNESTDYEVTVGANTLFITSDISGELIIPNLAPGTYDVSCLDVLSGCSSNTEVGIINDLWGLPNAGTNTLIDTCFYGPIDFLDLLGGTPDSGGIWIPALNSGTDIFDPLIDPSGNYTYSVSNNCGTSTSTIGITVTGICAGISGNVYNDISEDCTIDMNEPGIEDITIQINPGSYVVQTDSLGNWILPPLAAGTYTATIDSTNLNWSPTCPVSQSFTVTDPNTLTYAPDFGLVSNNQCSAPDISIYAPFMRRCFINQIYVQACNDEIASGVLPNAYIDIELDPHLILNSAITNQNFGSGTETYIDVTTDFWGYENYWELVPTGNPCGTGTIYSGGNPAVGCNGGGLKNQAPGGYPSNTTISEGPIYLTFGDQYDLRTVDDWGDGGTCYSLNGQTYCEGPNLSYGLLTFTAINGNINYTDLGNNVYRFDIGDLNPGECVNFTLNTTVSCDAILGETLCMDATLYPIESCALDTIPTPPLPPTYGNDPNLVMPQECTLPWDNSSLEVDGWCQGDSVQFSITNTGDVGGGDMDCYSPVLLYVNDTLVLIDSVQIQGQETVYFSYPAYGQTYILAAEQHPLHPGNSHPNAHVELCGSDSTQWIPDLVNNQPLDDADPVVDIYCGVVTGSYDPNDKTGYPLGVTDENFIHPNRQLQYVVRFQNTGTDTAFTVVIRDTLDTDLNIFTVNSGASSHEYTFQMKGQRILEWTFNNILLPDSTTNEPESNGFITFTVDQVPNLPEGTLITNQADIYFDLNEPIITNETEHRISYFTESNPLELTEVIAGDNHFTIYPNPNNGLLFIEMDDYSSSVDYTIFDFNGRPVLSGKLNQQKNAVYMQDLNPGAYVIQIDGSRPVRIIKK